MARCRYIADGVGVDVIGAGTTGDQDVAVLVVSRAVDESASRGQVVSMTWVT